jgi:hypothetical protein
VQTCTSTGTWSTTTSPCITSNPASSCFDYSVLSRPRAVCGVCAPGSTRCIGVDGGVAPAPTDVVETCTAAAQWGAPTTCVASFCDGVHGCVADCVPGAQVCIPGDPLSPEPPPVSYGASRYHACGSDGRVSPVPTPCPVHTSCRLDPNGNSYGCVVCVGTSNEAGEVDTACCPSAILCPGAPTGILTCKPTNDGYGTAQNCPAGTFCNPESDPRGALSPESCGVSQTQLRTQTNNPFATCAASGFGTVIACGGVLDCCSTSCTPPYSTASPAICAP